MAFQNPELNQFFQEILKRPRGQGAAQPPADPKAALARVLNRRRQRAVRLVTR
jgi:hypothetical protein